MSFENVELKADSFDLALGARSPHSAPPSGMDRREPPDLFKVELINDMCWRTQIAHW